MKNSIYLILCIVGIFLGISTISGVILTEIDGYYRALTGVVMNMFGLAWGYRYYKLVKKD